MAWWLTVNRALAAHKIHLQYFSCLFLVGDKYIIISRLERSKTADGDRHHTTTDSGLAGGSRTWSHLAGFQTAWHFHRVRATFPPSPTARRGPPPLLAPFFATLSRFQSSPASPVCHHHLFALSLVPLLSAASPAAGPDLRRPLSLASPPVPFFLQTFVHPSHPSPTFVSSSGGGPHQRSDSGTPTGRHATSGR